MEHLTDILAALGLPEETDEKTAVTVGYTRFKAGDRKWVDGLAEEAQAELQEAFIAQAKAAQTAVKVGKDEAAKRMEAAILEAEKAAKAADDQRQRDIEKTIEPVFTPREHESAAASVAKRTEVLLSKARVPQNWVADAEGSRPLNSLEKLHRLNHEGIEELAAFQEWSDTLYGLRIYLRDAEGLPRSVKATNYYQRTSGRFLENVKAMYSTGTNVGDEWVPDMWSGNLVEMVRYEARLMSMHPRVTMPSNPWNIPLEYTDPTAYLQGEAATDEAAKYKASTLGTNKTQLSAVKLAVRSLMSDEVQEDSIIAILPQLQSQIVYAMANALEDAMLNGQRTASIDTGDVPAGDDPRNAWDGYRYHASVVTDAAVNCATLTVNNLSKIQALMGKYGTDESRLMWVCSAFGNHLLRNLLDSQNNAVVMAGAPGLTAPGMRMPRTLLDIDVIRSGKMLDTLAGTGIYDGSSTSQTVIPLVYKPAYLIGDRREIRSERGRDIETGQTILVTTQRVGCINLFSAASNPTVGLAYNISTA